MRENDRLSRVAIAAVSAVIPIGRVFSIKWKFPRFSSSLLSVERSIPENVSDGLKMAAINNSRKSLGKSVE